MVDDHRTDEDDRPRSRRRTRTGSPGKITGRVVISSCSLAKVTIDPEKLTAPTTIVNAVAHKVEGRYVGAADEPGDLVQLQQRHQCRRAAADAVEQRHQLRHLGHLHPLRADDADHGPDSDRDQDQRKVVEVVGEEHRDGGKHRTSGAEQVAVACGLRRRQPLERKDEADGRDEVEQPGSGAAHARGSFRRTNICSIRSVTTKPPTMLTVASTMATNPTTESRRC